jgi:hypothetical protein
MADQEIFVEKRPIVTDMGAAVNGGAAGEDLDPAVPGTGGEGLLFPVEGVGEIEPAALGGLHGFEHVLLSI